MEKTFKFLLAGLLLTGFTACEGSDNGEKPGPNGEIKAPYTISVDKNEIEADGKDAANFILTDANGNVLTENEQLNYIVFENTATGNQLDKKTSAFTAVKNGTYTFKALYKNKPSENTVTVTAKNRSAYEKYFRKVAAYDITNVNCGYCPLMASALENTAAEWKQHMTVFAIHGPYDLQDPYIIGGVANNLLSKYIGSGSYPSAIFNLDYTMTGAGDAKPAFIAGVIEDQLRTCLLYTSPSPRDLRHPHQLVVCRQDHHDQCRTHLQHGRQIRHRLRSAAEQRNVCRRHSVRQQVR